MLILRLGGDKHLITATLSSVLAHLARRSTSNSSPMTTFSAPSIQVVWSWIQRLGPFGPGLVGLAGSAPFVHLPPGTADACLILFCTGGHESWAYYASMITLGEILGAYLTYRLAEKAGREILDKKLGKERADKVHENFVKHGFITVFSGAIAPPGFPFTPVQMAAGVLHYPRKKFFTALGTGRGLRFFTEAFLGRTYGPQMIAWYSVHARPVIHVLITLTVIAGLAGSIYYTYVRQKKRTAS